MSWEIRQGDALAWLRELADESVQTCITSPPYFGLRDYGQEGQIGLEATPGKYVQALVTVFGEVRRALRADGTFWLNLGDSYAGSWGAQSRRETPAGISGNQITNHPKRASHTGTIRQAGLKPKDLIGIPWMVAFALRVDGWYLRSDIIWAKPNPMPESVTDRPTRSHEYLFLLTKSARYFYDADAIREKHAVDWSDGRRSGQTLDHVVEDGHPLARGGSGQADRSATYRAFPNPAGRNRRSVWEIATQPYAEAHFATFPPKLIEPCVLAGSALDDLVLDPFAGAGTTGVVALRHGRSFIGIELNSNYCELARERIRNDGPLFNVASEVAA